MDSSVNSTLINYFGQIKASVHKRIYYIDELSTAPIISALMTGDRQAISERDMDAIRGAGIAHMLAISGLHVGLFSGAVFFIIRLLVVLFPKGGLFLPAKRIAACFACLSAAYYVGLAGASVPAVRALLMTGVVFLAIFLDRSAISMRLVAFAVVFLLLFAPENLLSISFQLSFLAVIALIAVYDSLRGFISRQMSKGGFLRFAALYVGGIILTSIVAALATAPVTAYYFHEIPLYGLLANLLAIPVLSFIVMPLCVIALCFMPLGLETVPLELMGQGVSLILRIAYFVDGLPHAAALVSGVSFISFVLCVCGILWFCLWRGALRLVAVMFLTLALFNFGQLRQPDIFITQDHKIWGYAFAADKFDDKSVDKKIFGKEGADSKRIFVSSFVRSKFAREQWREFYGLDSSQVQHFRDARDELGCDELACRLFLKGKRISFVRAKEVLRAECDWADLIVTQRALKGSDDCRAPNVIDYWRVKNKGAQAVYIENEHIVIEPIVQDGQKRPWTD